MARATDEDGLGLEDAIRSGDVSAVGAALDADAEAALRPLPGGLTPLLCALYHRDREITELLVSRGALASVHEMAALGDAGRLMHAVQADPDVLTRPGADGAFPLHLAAHFDHPAVVRTLLQLGADVNGLCGPFFSNRPLHAAVAGGAVEAVVTLLEHGADVDAADGAGNTPLHIAAANGNGTIVSVLLEKGASREAYTADGQTPFDVAQARGHETLLDLLRPVT